MMKNELKIDNINNSVSDKLNISLRLISLPPGSKKILIERKVIKIKTVLNINMFQCGACEDFVIINTKGEARVIKMQTIRTNGYSKNQPESAME